MTVERRATLDLADLRRSCERSATAFLAAHGDAIERYRAQISLGIDEALDNMRKALTELTDSATVRQVAEEASDYVSWMQWSLWDLPVHAVAFEPEPEDFRQSVAACGLVYISFRIFDDGIDQHFSYKGRHDTLLGAVTASIPNPLKAGGLNTLAGLLVCFEGLNELVQAPDDPATARTLRALVGAARKTVVGAIMEYAEPNEWSMDYYDQLVELKNVEYWRALYATLDPEYASPLYPFLEQYAALAQYLNDVKDYEDDVRWQQPNLIAIHRLLGDGARTTCPPLAAAGPPPAAAQVEHLLAERFLALAGLAAGLPDRERGVAEYQLAQALRAADELAVFGRPADEPRPGPEPGPPRLYW
jgi:hypothetical protein